MAIRFRCSACNQLLSIAARKAGTSVNCPTCGHSQAVPSTQAPTIPPASVPKSSAVIAAPFCWATIASAAPPAQAKVAPVRVRLPWRITAWKRGATWYKGKRRLIRAVSGVSVVLVGTLVVWGMEIWPDRTATTMPGDPIIVSTVPTPDAAGEAQDEGIRSCLQQAARAPSAAPTPAVDNNTTALKQNSFVSTTQPKAIASPMADRKDQSKIRSLPPATLAAPAKPGKVEAVEQKPVARGNEDHLPKRTESIILKRRTIRTDEELRRDLAKVTEVKLDAIPGTSGRLAALARNSASSDRESSHLLAQLILMRHDLAGLQLQMGEECKLDKEPAENLNALSRKLRSNLVEATPGLSSRGRSSGTADSRPDPQTLRRLLLGGGERHHWIQAEAIPTLQQILMGENKPLRMLLIEILSNIKGGQASVALARRAVFDLNAEVRESAVRALAGREVKEYEAVLLNALRHPWAPAADHAAEALAALKVQTAVPQLLKMLDAPAPTAPFRQSSPTGSVTLVREMVRINHFNNCLLCHAPSLNANDLVRGRRPDPNAPLPPAFSPEYYASRDTTGQFVRADRTYLKQDFSVSQPVARHGHWPENQRFDYVVRVRPARADEMSAGKRASENQKALLFALRELTGKDPGPSSEDWKKMILRTGQPLKVAGDLGAPANPVLDQAGNLFINDPTSARILKIDPSGKVRRLAGPIAVEAMTSDANGSLLVCQPTDRQIVALSTAPGEKARIVADKCRERRLSGPRQVAVDNRGGMYFTDSSSGSSRGTLYYRSAKGVVAGILDQLPPARGLGVSPDGKTLYLVRADVAEVMTYPIEGAGQIGKGELFWNLSPSRPGSVPTLAGLGIDNEGNVYVASPSAKAIQVLSSAGALLGVVRIAQTPTGCTFDAVKSTLYVTAGQSIYSVKIETVSLAMASR